MPPRITPRRLACAVLVILTGCGDSSSSIALVPVKGTITLNSEPLPKAKVAFMPDPGNPDQTAGGDTTGPAGNYLANFKGRSGLAPGKYTVIVTPSVETDTSDVDSVVKEAFKDDPFMMEEMQRSTAAGRARKKSAKPAPQEEQFTVEVTAEGGVFDKDLKR